MVNTDMAQRAMITGSNEQDLRSETIAGSSVASGSTATVCQGKYVRVSCSIREIIYVSCWAVC
jgi:hypothetical protein